MYKFEFEYTLNGVKYVAWAYGETIDTALEHARFWDSTIPETCNIHAIISVEPIDYYPYCREDALRLAFSKPIPFIHAVLQQDGICDDDKVDLIKIVTAKDPTIHLDTACWDYLIDIVNENLCDDISQLIMEWTDPLQNLTEEDAGRIMSDMEANGYTLPIGLTPKEFIEIYKECEPEGEEENE